jgi:protein gp37
MVAPIIGPVDLSAYLDDTIEEVAVSGESGVEARPCDYDWILNIREQCVKAGVPFRFHQTGAYFIKDGKTYRIHRKYQLSQAHKANIDYKIDKFYVPETIKFEWKDEDYHD